MSSVNKVTIVGRLGCDPETVYAQSGVAITTLSIATSEKWKDKNTGEQKDETEWHRVKAFSGQAETLAKYTQKGSLLYIEGRLKTSVYTKDGEKRYSTDIILSAFKFLGPKSDNQDNQQASGFQSNQQPPAQQNQNPINNGFANNNTGFQPNHNQQPPPNQGFQTNTQPMNHNQQQSGFEPNKSNDSIPF